MPKFLADFCMQLLDLFAREGILLSLQAIALPCDPLVGSLKRAGEVERRVR